MFYRTSKSAVAQNSVKYCKAMDSLALLIQYAALVIRIGSETKNNYYKIQSIKYALQDNVQKHATHKNMY